MSSPQDEIAAVESEIAAILADEELSEHERNDSLGELIRRRRDAFRRCRDLSLVYVRKAKGRPGSDADEIVRELLASPEFMGLIGLSALLFAVYMHGTFARPSPLRTFPLPSLLLPVLTPRYVPRSL